MEKHNSAQNLYIFPNLKSVNLNLYIFSLMPMKESQIVLRSLNKLGLQMHKRLIEYQQDQSNYVIEVSDDLTLTTAIDLLIHKPVILLRIDLKSYLPMKDTAKDKEHIEGLFRLMSESQQIYKVVFSNTSYYNYTFICSSLSNLKVNESLRCFEFMSNKFLTKASETFIRHLLGHQFLTEIKLDDCKFSSSNLQALIEVLTQNNQRLRTFSLRKLRFSNKMTTEDTTKILEQLAAAINNLKVLRNLDISENEDMVPFFIQVLSGNNTVINLRLEKCFLKDNGIIMLQNALSENRNIETLDLSSNYLKGESGQYLGRVVSKNQSIKRLILNNNDFQDQGLKYILEEVLQSKGCLDYIDISQNHVQMEGTTANTLSQCIKQGRIGKILLSHNSISADTAGNLLDVWRENDYNCFRELNLETNQRLHSGGAAIASIIQGSQILEFVRLNSCGLDDEVCIAMADAFTTNQSLNNIHMGYNPGITCIGAQALAESLLINNTLKVLQLHNCNIGQTGALEFAKILKTNQRLTRLILKSNRNIGNMACNEILKSLKYNNGLIVINLEDCGMETIDDETVESLRDNKCLEILWVVNNLIGIGSGRQIEAILSGNNMIKQFNLQGNQLTDQDVAPILNGMRNNHTIQILTLINNQFDNSGKVKLKEFKSFKIKID